MKPGLRRIEATLNQLHAQTPSSTQNPAGGQLVLSNQASHQAASVNQPPPISDNSLSGTSSHSFIVRSTQALQKQSSTLTFEGKTEGHDTVKPFPVQDNNLKTPNLPKAKVPNFSNHRHAANPGFAMGLLREMEGIVGSWQMELQQILLQVQEIYLEGPIVDGWLESDTRSRTTTGEPRTASEKHIEVPVAILRHADADQLMSYVQEICTAHPETLSQTQPRTGYRLCGLDADGQPWSRPCPPEQVPQVSLAIARYQKLRQLLGRKQHLESRLSQFAQDLIELHSKLQ